LDRSYGKTLSSRITVHLHSVSISKNASCSCSNNRRALPAYLMPYLLDVRLENSCTSSVRDKQRIEGWKDYGSFNLDLQNPIKETASQTFVWSSAMPSGRNGFTVRVLEKVSSRRSEGWLPETATNSRPSAFLAAGCGTV